ncbi:LLM class flavin-dependent oxidoreductase [Alphaproteobacteria bacterium]|jgi:alkanesulfonate monooxygenase SsuD/methylene tetrahydromethanopterin reductase-like flavin-dependent oxidoreductase (luciferase family)|nr:LLM class flavin-dependent oxidoreductase [Alphaproteobacteria bacterium]
MNQMKFGIMMRGQFPQGDRVADRFEEMLAQARLAESLGYHSITKGAHYSTHPLQDLQQVPFLCRVAAEAPSLRLNTGVMLLPLHKPLDVAEQIGTLDIMTNGKAIFGCGVGYRDVEFKAFGTSRKVRGKRFEENLTAIKRLWTEDTVTIKGSHFELDDASCSAKPVQQPHPPIWIGASADAAIQRAAQMGTCWYVGPNDRLDAVADQLETYKRALDDADKPFPEEFPFRREVFVAPTREEAFRIAKGPIMQKYQAYHAWGLGRSRPGETDELGQPFEDLMKDRFFIGSPDDVAEQIIKFNKQLGMNHIVMSLHWPGLEVSQSMETMQILAEEVFPKVRQGL